VEVPESKIYASINTCLQRTLRKDSNLAVVATNVQDPLAGRDPLNFLEGLV